MNGKQMADNSEGRNVDPSGSGGIDTQSVVRDSKSIIDSGVYRAVGGTGSLPIGSHEKETWRWLIVAASALGLLIFLGGAISNYIS